MSTLSDAISCDVLVVGMGPAGATAAYELSRSGLSVIGLEKYRHPRYKVCGGGLSARIDHILDDGFRSVVEHAVHSVHFSYGGKEPLLIDSGEPFAYMVMRNRFDQFLADKARSAGTVIREDEAAEKFSELPAGIEVMTNQRRYRTKMLIGADGANSAVAQWLFPERRLRRMPTVETEIDIGAEPLYPGDGTALIDLGATNKGYAWIFPKKERLSVGLGGFDGRMAGPKRFFRRFINDEIGLSKMDVPPPIGHPLPLYTACEDGFGYGLVGHRAVLVGDAGHLVDPLFGEGIYYAIRSGQLAAASIVAFFQNANHSMQEYEQAVAKEIYTEFNVAARMAKIIYTIPHLCHWLAFHYQDVVRLYYDVLRGRETYQTFATKAKGMIKASVRDFLRHAISFS
ncbi:MAG TPA: geranylgeranyl reductase family protein [Nitrospiraceae bacterium]|nr:geranylgeranyl reductase family protein [Nitrospiraceae bacterium]